MNIAMIGAGYVGLTTGACLADLGHRVTCLDVVQARIDRLNAGELPIYEPGLESVVARGRDNGRLHFSSDLDTVRNAAAVFLAVGTPSRPDGAIDLSYVEQAARDIAPLLARDAVVVVKSTVITGTAKRIREIIAETRGALDFSVASNPEFLREGSAVEDFKCPDRIVLGADDPRARRALHRIYAPLLRSEIPCVETSTTNAELIKYAANALLALKIGFINEVADLCEQIGGDVAAVAHGVGLDARIGRAFLNAGPGFGGSCFPKDTRAFAALGRQAGAPQHIVEKLIVRNEERKAGLARRILGYLPKPRGARIAVLGIAFKANTDDVRDSAALSIIPMLQAAGCEVHAHDPQADARAQLPGVAWHTSPYEAAQEADLVVVLTEWDAYRQLDLGRLAEAMAGRVLFDCRDVISAAAAGEAGLDYVAIGRGRTPPATGHSSVRDMTSAAASTA